MLGGGGVHLMRDQSDQKENNTSQARRCLPLPADLSAAAVLPGPSRRHRSCPQRCCPSKAAPTPAALSLTADRVRASYAKAASAPSFPPRRDLVYGHALHDWLCGPSFTGAMTSAAVPWPHSRRSCPCSLLPPHPLAASSPAASPASVRASLLGGDIPRRAPF